MDIKDVDLNLLKVFDALRKKQSVTLAGDLMGLSQPAMSFALAKLRTLFDDPLFIRTSRGMQPTARALQIAEPVQRILEMVSSEVLPSTGFVAEHSERQLVLCMSDIGEMVFLPRLMRMLDSKAPQLRIRTLALSSEQLEEGLDAGEVDAAIGYFPRLLNTSIRHRALYRHSFVCIVRRDHPTIGDSMSAEQYQSAMHVAVQPDGRGMSGLDRELASHGITRRVRFSLPRFMGVPFLVAESDMIATVPLAVGRRFADITDVRLVPLPWDICGYDIHLYWHTRFHHDPANRWLRQSFIELLDDFLPQTRYRFNRYRK
ncbi:LysR family transcriptional regulator [Pseudomonas sp. PSB1]|uniref:LysR family transcriptional regulator n=1 Tax=Pseudomonas sp. PSB1 TaxID=477819 RepID=UPI0016612BE1|nr:LysR family transcriptional regulator [Pseudomonas sp. PSB1]MBD0701449.1 LysR family transcriptional regulator [Pseudomonas sp. PSB1]